MAAYNDRRTGEERRRGDRRWLSIFTGRRPVNGKSFGERRIPGDRRKRSPDLRIGF